MRRDHGIREGGAGLSGQTGSAMFRKDEGFQIQIVTCDPGVHAHGRLAAGLEEFQKAALGGDAGEGFGVVQGGKDGGQRRGFLPCFEGDGSLTGGREEVGRIEDAQVQRMAESGENFLIETETMQARAGEDDGIDAGLVCGFAEARGDISADFNGAQIRPEMLEEPDAAHAAGGDGAPGRKGIKATRGFGNENVFDGGAGEDGADFEAGIEKGGHVFEAMHCGVDGAGAEGIFEFFGKDPFVDHGGFPFGKIGKAEIWPEVTGGFDDFAVYYQARVRGMEGGSGEDSLGESEFTAAGSES